MTELLLILITWFITKLYYTKSPLFKLNDSDVITTRCYRCGNKVTIAKAELRSVNYCYTC